MGREELDKEIDTKIALDNKWKEKRQNVRTVDYL